MVHKGYGLNPTESCVPMFVSIRTLILSSLYVLEKSVFVKTNLSQFIFMACLYQTYAITFLQFIVIVVLGKSIVGMAPIVYNKLLENLK